MSFLKCITIQCEFLLIITTKYPVCSVGILKINFVKICLSDVRFSLGFKEKNLERPQNLPLI